MIKVIDPKDIDFVTLDYEYADRILPSICSISIFFWKDKKMVEKYNTLIDPECEIEEFFTNRHLITDEMVKGKPKLRYIWKDIYDMINGHFVFIHNANRSVHDLQVRTLYDHMNMPNFVFLDTHSLAKRTWRHFEEFKLPDLNKRLKLVPKDYNSMHDAVAVAKIVYLALEEHEAKTVQELFSKVGFAGGFMFSGKRIPYRAIKRDGSFIPRVKIKPDDSEILYKFGDIDLIIE